MFDGGASSVAVMSRPPTTFCHSRLLFLSVVFFFFTAPKDKVKRVDRIESEAGEIRRVHQGRV